jgi:hypothetical protein
MSGIGENGGPPEPKRTMVCVGDIGRHPSRSVNEPSKTVGPLMLKQSFIELTDLLTTTRQFEGTSIT